jgi:hypothetical protein
MREIVCRVNFRRKFAGEKQQDPHNPGNKFNIVNFNFIKYLIF